MYVAQYITPRHPINNAARLCWFVSILQRRFKQNLGSFYQANHSKIFLFLKYFQASFLALVLLSNNLAIPPNFEAFSIKSLKWKICSKNPYYAGFIHTESRESSNVFLVRACKLCFSEIEFKKRTEREAKKAFPGPNCQDLAS